MPTFLLQVSGRGELGLDGAYKLELALWISRVGADARVGADGVADALCTVDGLAEFFEAVRLWDFLLQVHGCGCKVILPMSVLDDGADNEHLVVD